MQASVDGAEKELDGRGREYSDGLARTTCWFSVHLNALVQSIYMGSGLWECSVFGHL